MALPATRQSGLAWNTASSSQLFISALARVAFPLSRLYWYISSLKVMECFIIDFRTFRRWLWPRCNDQLQGYRDCSIQIDHHGGAWGCISVWSPPSRHWHRYISGNFQKSNWQKFIDVNVCLNTRSWIDDLADGSPEGLTVVYCAISSSCGLEGKLWANGALYEYGKFDGIWWY